MPSPQSGVYIGAQTANYAEFIGDLDQTRIYGAALDAETIQALYQEEKP